MCQGHGQHRCLALNPCHKQNTGRDSAVPRPLTCGSQSSAPRGAGWAPCSSPYPRNQMRGRHRTSEAALQHGAAMFVADTGSAPWS